MRREGIKVRNFLLNLRKHCAVCFSRLVLGMGKGFFIDVLPAAWRSALIAAESLPLALHYCNGPPSASAKADFCASASPRIAAGSDVPRYRYVQLALTGLCVKGIFQLAYPESPKRLNDKIDAYRSMLRQSLDGQTNRVPSQGEAEAYMQSF